EAAEADEAVHGQADEAAEGVLRLAGAAGGALVADADLTEADEGAQAADEAHLLRQMSQYLDDLAIHQAEVAAVERDGQIADGVEHAIEEGVTGALDQAFLALGADGVDDVVAGPPGGDELVEHLGRILQIAVHDDDGLAAGVIESGTDRRLMAEVAAEVHHR